MLSFNRWMFRWVILLLSATFSQLISTYFSEGFLSLNRLIIIMSMSLISSVMAKITMLLSMISYLYSRIREFYMLILRPSKYGHCFWKKLGLSKSVLMKKQKDFHLNNVSNKLPVFLPILILLIKVIFNP